MTSIVEHPKFGVNVQVSALVKYLDIDPIVKLPWGLIGFTKAVQTHSLEKELLHASVSEGLFDRILPTFS